MMVALASICPDFNFPAFFYASLLLILLGVIVYVFTLIAKDNAAIVAKGLKDAKDIAEAKEVINNINGKIDNLIEEIRVNNKEVRAGNKELTKSINTLVDEIRADRKARRR